MSHWGYLDVRSRGGCQKRKLVSILAATPTQPASSWRVRHRCAYEPSSSRSASVREPRLRAGDGMWIDMAE